MKHGPDERRGGTLLRHSVFRFIRNAEEELFSLLEDKGFATPRVETGSSAGKKLGRALVEFHFLNPSDCCLYSTSSRSPIRDAVLAGFDMDAVREAATHYAVVLHAYRNELATSVDHVRNLVNRHKFARCVGHEKETNAVRSDLEDLFRLLNAGSSSESVPEDFVHRLGNYMDDYLGKRSRRHGSEEWCILDRILRYLPVPVDSDRKSRYEQSLGHSWFTEPEGDSLNLIEVLRLRQNPQEQLSALTDILTLAPWIRMRESSYRKFFAVAAKHLASTDSVGDAGEGAESGDSANQFAQPPHPAQGAWARAIKEIGNDRAIRVPPLRYLEFRLANSVAPLGAIRVVHNRVKDWEDFERAFTPKLRDIGHRLSIDLTYSLSFGVAATLDQKGVDFSETKRPLAEVFDMLVPCWDVTVLSGHDQATTIRNEALHEAAQRYHGAIDAAGHRKFNLSKDFLSKDFEPIGPIEFVPFFQPPRPSDILRYSQSALDAHWTRIQQVLAHVVHGCAFGSAEPTEVNEDAAVRDALPSAQPFDLQVCLRLMVKTLEKKDFIDLTSDEFVCYIVGIFLAAEAYGLGISGKEPPVGVLLDYIEKDLAFVSEVSSGFVIKCSDIGQIEKALVEHSYQALTNDEKSLLGDSKTKRMAHLEADRRNEFVRIHRKQQLKRTFVYHHRSCEKIFHLTFLFDLIDENKLVTPENVEDWKKGHITLLW